MRLRTALVLFITGVLVALTGRWIGGTGGEVVRFFGYGISGGAGAFYWEARRERRRANRKDRPPAP